MMAVCGWEPQPHVPSGMKGWRRMKSPPLAHPKCWAYLWVHRRGDWTVHQKVIRKCHIWQDMEWSCQKCSCQAGHMTSSTFHQGSRVNYCPIAQYIRPVHTTQLVVWCSESEDTTMWQRHDHQWASETCSWLKQTPWWHRCHRWWNNLLVHLSHVTHDEGTLLLVGEGVRYHISYC